jgi:hypothetical protein
VVALTNGVDGGGVDDAVTVADNDRAPDVRFGLAEGMAGSELRLVG